MARNNRARNSRANPTRNDANKQPGPWGDEGSHIVQLNYRYRGAWSELNTRIAQRQNALQIYVVLVSTIFGLSIAFFFDRNGGARDSFKPLVSAACFLIAIISLTFSFLNYKHERTIELLRKFLRKCEGINNPAPGRGTNVLPKYNEDYYFKKASQFRRWHDIAFVILILVFNGAALFVLILNECMTGQGWPMGALFLMYTSYLFLFSFAIGFCWHRQSSD